MQTFNDGLVAIYSVTNNAEPGETPANKPSAKASLRYEERTVGVNRFYAGKQQNYEVAYLLRCPMLRCVTTGDIAVPNDGLQYEIKKIEYKDGTGRGDAFVGPPVMDLSLVRQVRDYDLE